MPAPANQLCQTCRYFFALAQAGVDYGECHRYPPTDGHKELDSAFTSGATLPTSLQHHAWALADNRGWCGEYQVNTP